MSITYVDNYVLDHTGEFFYDESNDFAQLFHTTPAPFVDAVSKLLHAVMTSKVTYLPPEFTSKSQHGKRLRQFLIDKEFAKSDDVFDSPRREYLDAEAYRLVRREIWPNVNKLAEDRNSGFLQILLDQGLREHVRFFSDPHWGKKGYLEEPGEFILDETARNYLVENIWKHWNDRVQKPPKDKFEVWLDRNYAGHYLNFAWYRCIYGFSYLPGKTRTHSGLFAAENAQEIVDRAMIPCIAFDVLSRCHGRGATIEQAMTNWRSDHGKLIARIQLLEASLMGGDAGAMQLADEIAQELRKRNTLILYVAKGIRVAITAGTLQVLESMKIIEEAATQSGPVSSWWWLLRFPGKGTDYHTLAERMSMLVKGDR